MGTSVIEEITTLVNLGTTAKDSALQGLVDGAARLVGADRATLILFDEKAGEVRQFLRGGVGWAEVMASISFTELHQGLSGWVLRTGELALSPKDKPDDRESPEVQARRQATGCGSILVAPLGPGWGRFGTITAINRSDQPDFTPEDGRSLGLFAGFATQTVLAAEAREAAAAAARSKMNFLSNLSHELRTPLNGILGFGHILAETPLDEYQKSMLGTVLESGVRLLGTIDNVLDLAQMEAGVYVVESSPFSPRSVLDAVTGKFRPQAVEKGLQFRVTTDPDLPAILDGDEEKLGQAWGHILSNAVKFTDRGSIDIHLSDHLTAWDKHELVLEVNDTGIGILEKHQGKWFRPFHQEDGSFTRRFGGTGLGLALCDRIVRKMGGGVSLLGHPGVGTSARIWVVLGAAGEGPVPVEQTHLRILLVHPDPVGGQALVKMIDRLGHKADVAGNLEQAGGRLAAQKYEVVLVDLCDSSVDLTPMVETSVALGAHLVGLFPAGTDPGTLPGAPWTACLVQPVGYLGLQSVLDLCFARREP